MSSIPFRPSVGLAVLVTASIVAAVVAHISKSSPSANAEPPSPELAEACPSPSPALELEAAEDRGASGPQFTNHGRLVLDGHFAQRIGLLEAFKEVALPGKTVLHAPAEHLATAFVNILAGHRHLQQISRGETPLRADLALAHAWEQEQFPEVSGVCRQLHAVDWEVAEAVRERLRVAFDPYVALCRGRAQNQGERLVVDWDLTAKEITTDATSEPFATYGHMEAGLGKGYQWVEATLRGKGPEGEDRPVSLGGFLRPGNAHPSDCLERLRLITEASLGHPRRQPELLASRLAAARLGVQQQEEKVDLLRDRLERCERRLWTAQGHLRAVMKRQPTGQPSQEGPVAEVDSAVQAAAAVQAALRRVEKAQQRLEGAQARLAAAQVRLEEMEQTVAAMTARLERLRAENEALDTGEKGATAMELVMDAQFGGSEQVATLIEEGYQLTTKAISPATVSTLLRRQARGEALFGPWEEVSANAQVSECAETRYAACPHPLRLLGYRKELAASASREAKVSHALILTTVPAQERGAAATVDHYHVRGGTVELVNRLAKSYLGWRGHRLRHAPGLDILGQFVFVGLNFVSWSADTIWVESGPEAGKIPGLAALSQMARTPADVLSDEDGVVIQFRPYSGWPGRSLRLGALRQPPLPGFVWPGVPINAQGPLQNSKPDLVARKLG